MNLINENDTQEETWWFNNLVQISVRLFQDVFWRRHICRTLPPTLHVFQTSSSLVDGKAHHHVNVADIPLNINGKLQAFYSLLTAIWLWDGTG